MGDGRWEMEDGKGREGDENGKRKGRGMKGKRAGKRRRNGKGRGRERKGRDALCRSAGPAGSAVARRLVQPVVVFVLFSTSPMMKKVPVAKAPQHPTSPQELVRPGKGQGRRAVNFRLVQPVVRPSVQAMPLRPVPHGFLLQVGFVG